MQSIHCGAINRPEMQTRYRRQRQQMATMHHGILVYVVFLSSVWFPAAQSTKQMQMLISSETCGFFNLRPIFRSYWVKMFTGNHKTATQWNPMWQACTSKRKALVFVTDRLANVIISV